VDGERWTAGSLQAMNVSSPRYPATPGLPLKPVTYRKHKEKANLCFNHAHHYQKPDHVWFLWISGLIGNRHNLVSISGNTKWLLYLQLDTDRFLPFSFITNVRGAN
jgi:hypothetical protein